MKQRIITACVGLCVLAVVLAKFDTWALNLAVSVISLLAVGEVLHVIDSGSRTLTGIGLIFSVLIPFSRIAAIRAVLPSLSMPLLWHCSACFWPGMKKCMWKKLP